ncbi:MAG: hypothetical protein ACN0LA_10010 [Candidatus Longimicrobiales bacterium M2_2A_002]
MTAPTQLLEEAGQTLARAEALIQRAGEQLGSPFDEPLELHAAEVQRIRKQLRNAFTTLTAGGRGG